MKVFPAPRRRQLLTRQELFMGLGLAVGVWFVLTPWVVILFLS